MTNYGGNGPGQTFPGGDTPKKPKKKHVKPGIGTPGTFGSGRPGNYGANGVSRPPFAPPAPPKAVRPVPVKKKTPPKKKTTTPVVTRTSGVRSGGPAVSRAGSGGGSAGAGSTAPSVTLPSVKPPVVTKMQTAAAQVDPIQQMIAGSLQQAQRLTDYYDKQTIANQAATTDNASALAAAAGSLSSTVPKLGYVGAGTLGDVAQSANSYTDLINAVGQTNAKTDAQTNQALIADSGNALQKYFGQARAAQDMANAQFGTQLKASEPDLRAKYASDQADLAMKQAEQQYLQDKLSLTGKTAQANLQLGYDRLNSSNSNSAANRQTKLTIAQQSAANAQYKAKLAAAMKGQAMSAAQRKVTQAWIDKHLFYKDPTSGSMTQNGDIDYTTILDQLGSLSGPAAAAQAAITYSAPSIRKGGVNNFYSALVGHGMSKRQAIKYLSGAGFNQRQIDQIKRYGVASTGFKGATDNVAAAGSAVTGAVRAAG